METRVTEKDTVRITVGFGRHRMDVSLPLHTPISHMLPDLAALLASELSESSGSSREQDWLTQPRTQHTLGPQIGRPFPRDKSLREVGVVEGAYVLFSTEDRNERQLNLVDDLAEAGAEDLSRRYAGWDNNAAQRLAGYALPLAALVLAVALGLAPALGDFGPWRWAGVGVLALTMAVCTTVAVGVAKWDRDRLHLVTPVSAAAYLAGAGLGLAVIPEHLGRWQVVTVSVILLALSGLFVMTVRQPLNLHYAVGTAGAVGALTAIIALVNAAVSSEPIATYQVASIAGVLAFLAMRLSGRIGLIGAGVDKPSVPAAGEDLIVPESAQLVKISRSVTVDSEMASVVNQSERSVDTRNIVLGILTGAPLTAAVAAVAATATSASWTVLALFATLTVVMTVRGTWYGDAVQRSVLMGTGMVIMLGTAVGFAVNADTSPILALASGLVFFLAAVAGSVAAWQQAKPLSPATRHAAEIAEALLIGSVLVYLFFILELWSAVRNS